MSKAVTLEQLQIVKNYIDSKTGGGGNTDPHTVTINNETISLQAFVDNCEAGLYDSTKLGSIATIKKGNTDLFRIILIGVNHDVLAKDGTTKAKTTWQFYDIPIKECYAGYPFNIIDTASGSGRTSINSYLDGTNTADMQIHPSTKGGYPTASGLAHSLQVAYEALPMILRNSIKMVQKEITIPRIGRSIVKNGGAETDTSLKTHVNEMLFHLSATEAGHKSFKDEGTIYAYMTSNENRKRYYKNQAFNYWTRSVSSSGYEIYYVDNTGPVAMCPARFSFSVAPAFCI